MAQGWAVAVAEHRRDELAEFDLETLGFGVHIPRSFENKRLWDGSSGMVGIPTYRPYFYVRFNLESREEYATAKSCRGVRHFLESRPLMPAEIPESIILDHRDRERHEKAKQTRRQSGRTDLLIGFKYLITAGLFAGKTGTLFEAYGGRAYLDVGAIVANVPDRDIELAAEERKRA